jgi:hypothetical protein
MGKNLDRGGILFFLCGALFASSAHSFTQSARKTKNYWLNYEDAQICESPLWESKTGVGSRSPRTPGAPGNFFSLFEGNRSIFRGRSPSTPEQMEFLKKKEINEVIVFKDWRTEEERKSFERRYLNAGFSKENLHWIAFPWSHTRDYKQLCKQTVEALQIMKNVVESSRKGESGNLYLHCTAGEDRTGFLSGLFRILKNDWDLEDTYAKELCARGYADGNPKKPAPVADEVHRTLTPLFEDMGKMIKKGALHWEELDSTACDQLRTRRGKTTLPACQDLKGTR